MTRNAFCHYVLFAFSVITLIIDFSLGGAIYSNRTSDEINVQQNILNSVSQAIALHERNVERIVDPVDDPIINIIFLSTNTTSNSTIFSPHANATPTPNPGTSTSKISNIIPTTELPSDNDWETYNNPNGDRHKRHPSSCSKSYRTFLSNGELRILYLAPLFVGPNCSEVGYIFQSFGYQ